MMLFYSTHLDGVLVDTDMYMHLSGEQIFFSRYYSAFSKHHKVHHKICSIAVSLIGVLSEGQIFVSSKTL